MDKEAEVHPIVLALRDALREMAKRLTPDVAPADVYCFKELSETGYEPVAGRGPAPQSYLRREPEKR